MRALTCLAVCTHLDWQYGGRHLLPVLVVGSKDAIVSDMLDHPLSYKASTDAIDLAELALIIPPSSVVVSAGRQRQCGSAAAAPSIRP